MKCQHDGLRFGVGKTPCERTDVSQYNAGCYGSAWLCPEHRIIATRLCGDADAAESQGGLALAQMLKDERAMMR